jgi:hypothetical protein
VSAPKTFEVIVEKVYELRADSLEEAQALANDGAVEFNGYCVQAEVVSVHEVYP